MGKSYVRYINSMFRPALELSTLQRNLARVIAAKYSIQDHNSIAIVRIEHANTLVTNGALDSSRPRKVFGSKHNYKKYSDICWHLRRIRGSQPFYRNKCTRIHHHTETLRHQIAFKIHFPMQKSRKITSKISSAPILPEIFPISINAIRKYSADITTSFST